MTAGCFSVEKTASGQDAGITVASYNIHRCYGNDGLYNPERIRKVLRQINADVVALQEVELLHENPQLLDYLCEDSPWQAVSGLTLSNQSGHYGNALLTSLEIDDIRRIDISVPAREPRGVISARLHKDQLAMHVVATHLGLRPFERRAQIMRILDELKQQKAAEQAVTVLMGDLNEWFLWGRPVRWLQRHFKATPAPATYPARFPLFSLDRIWVEPRSHLLGVKTLRNKLTRVASDHLPLVAQIRFRKKPVRE